MKIVELEAFCDALKPKLDKQIEKNTKVAAQFIKLKKVSNWKDKSKGEQTLIKKGEEFEAVMKEKNNICEQLHHQKIVVYGLERDAKKKKTVF